MNLQNRRPVRLGAALIACAMCVQALAALDGVSSGSYGLDKTHGYITFTYSHLGFSNPHVGFNDFDVTLDLDSANPESSKLEVTIDASSIDSRIEEFNGHLNGEEFFDTANHPTITFVATDIKSTGEDSFDINGDLSIKGTTKPVTLKATINKAADHPIQKRAVIGVEAETKVNRADWGLTKAIPYVSDEVTIYISVELPQN